MSIAGNDRSVQVRVRGHQPWAFNRCNCGGLKTRHSSMCRDCWHAQMRAADARKQRAKVA